MQKGSTRMRQLISIYVFSLFLRHSDMEELIHTKIHELGTEGYFKSLAE